MMKGVAVPYIIAILLGVGVIGLIGYWLFVSGGRLGEGEAKVACENDVVRACNVALAAGTTSPTWTQSDNCKRFGDYETLDAAACKKFGITLVP